MKKKIITLAACIMVLTPLVAQVGVNTTTPQGTFHVDGAKDNPTVGNPDPTQQSNDFVVTNTGSIGVGTVTPSSKVEINSGTANTSGLKFSNMNATTPITTGAAPLGVNASGEVVVATGSGTGGTNIYNSDGTLSSYRTITNPSGLNLVGGGPFSIKHANSNEFNFLVQPFNGSVYVSSLGSSTPLTVTGRSAGTTGSSGVFASLDISNAAVMGTTLASSLKIYPGFASNGTVGMSGYPNYVTFVTGTDAPGMPTFDFNGKTRAIQTETLSDRRLKDNIKDLNEYGIAEVLKMQPRRYTLKGSGTPDIGFIAQELKEITPEIVHGEGKEILAVEYGKISLILVNAIKEQQTMIKSQQTMIKSLQDEVESLKTKIQK